MAQLSVDQLATRATKKRNNKIKKDLPLLAAQEAIPADWLTTEAEQKARIERQHQAFAEWWKEFEKRKEEQRLLAERMKAEVRELVDDEEKFRELERGTKWTDHLGPEYALDYWHRVLARLDPKHCPHFKDNHAVSRALGHSQCPVCLQIVAD